MRFHDPIEILTWPTPNYVNPVTKGPALYIIISFFFFFATAAVFLRLYTRLFIRKWIGADDAIIFLAWLCDAGNVATIYWGNLHFYWNRHMWDGHPEVLSAGAQNLMAAKLFWATSSNLVRLSILCFFYRLANHLQINKYKWVLHCVTVLVVCILLTYLGTIIFACFPVREYFEWPSGGTCIDELYTDTIMAALNTFTEFLVAIFPVPVVFTLNMSNTQRWSILSLISLGILVTAVGCARTYYVWILFSSDDLTWWSTPYWICSEVEICTAIICACLPTLRPFIRRYFSSRRSIVRQVTMNSFGKQSQVTTSNGTRRSLEYRLPPLPSFQHHFDLEGIAVDDYSYVVTITGGPPATQRARNYWRFGGTRFERKTSPTAPKRSLSRLGNSVFRQGITPIEEDPLRIATTMTLELRESWHHAVGTSWFLDDSEKRLFDQDIRERRDQR